MFGGRQQTRARKAHSGPTHLPYRPISLRRLAPLALALALTLSLLLAIIDMASSLDLSH